MKSIEDEILGLGSINWGDVGMFDVRIQWKFKYVGVEFRREIIIKVWFGECFIKRLQLKFWKIFNL